MRQIRAFVLGVVTIAGLATVSSCSKQHVEESQLSQTRSEAPASDPQGAYDFFREQRLSPEVQEYPFQHLRAARRQVEARERAQETSKSEGRPVGDIKRWSELGPGNIGGRTRALAIDPTAPEVMYAGGVAGGIWKTEDGGGHWRQLDDAMINMAVTSLAIDPDDSSVVYAATGEGFSWSGMVRGLGIFKSADAGETWRQLRGTVSGVPEGAFHWVNDLVISPNDGARIFAATRFGVWRSTDAGASWSAVLGNPRYMDSAQMTRGSTVGCTELASRSDRFPDVIFAAFGIVEEDGLYRSEDGGDSWTRMQLGDHRQGRMALAIAPSDNRTIYVSMAQNFSGVYGMLADVYRSDDGGETWQGRVDFDFPTGRWLLSNYFIASGCVDEEIYHQGWYDNAIAADPLDPEMVWLGGINLFRSDDGGQTFLIGEGPAADSPSGYLHVDHHALVFHPEYDGLGNQTLYTANDGGIARTQRARAPAGEGICPPRGVFAWRNLNNSYAVTQFYHGDSAKDRVAIVGGTQDNGTNLVISTLAPNSWALIYGGDGGYVAIDPSDSRVIYIETQLFPNILKSTDAGHSFAPATTGITDTDGLFITPFAMDQAFTDTLWTGGTRPWRTTDGAEHWQPVGHVTSGGGKISAIGIAPSDSDTVYLGYTTGVVARTSNGRDTDPSWQIWWDSLPDAYVSSITVDHFDPEVAYCTISTFGTAHVFKTEDGGSTWLSIDGIGADGIPDVPAHWIAIRPCNDKQLYVATEVGVLVSDNCGRSWNPANFGLPHTVVESLDFNDDDTLIAFTYGRGVFQAELESCPAPRRSRGRFGPG